MAFSTKKKVKRIYILGAGVMQLPAIKAAKGFGWEVVCADGNSNAPGIGEADYFEHIDLRDTEQIAESVFHWKKSRGLNGVFTAGTDFSACVATAAEKSGLPGVSLESALNATDKSRMRSMFKQKGVPSPRFEMIDSPVKKLAALQSVGLPLVIKPVDNMGARGIRRVDSEEQYNAAFQAALEHSRSGRIIVEEYLEGPEFSLDALVYNGDITICGIADRNIKFSPYFIETGHTMPTVFSREDQHRVADVFIQGIKALGINNGAAKGDIKLTPRGAVVGEIAARLSGGYMSGWTYPLSSGVALTAAALKIAVGDPPGDLNPSKHHVSAERAFYSIPGIVESISGFEPESGEAAFLSVKPGDSVVFPRNNVEKCGNYIFSSRERKTAEKLAEEACRNVIIRLSLEPGQPLSFFSVKMNPGSLMLFLLKYKQTETG